MTETPAAPRRIAEIASYHAHIYYDVATTKVDAEILRRQIAERFSVRVGNWHDEQVGPHRQSMYQIAFATPVFATLVPWLMLNRRGLSILVHPNTDRPRDDHLIQPLWLGPSLPIRGEVLGETLDEDELPENLPPNTTPQIDDI
ncbi:MAG TPA: DOPA 4,5-dioxygenase family protein [Candidatus Nitrosotalea sp.]|jgi:DOPA 4,5-dioxygenase|nr:DOPA 4,5-dioxygenase family protein [Candidatus Nitrosotalea sp.]